MKELVYNGVAMTDNSVPMCGKSANKEEKQHQGGTRKSRISATSGI
jgi:hypothetical protein